MDFHNRKLDGWAQRFLGVSLADEPPPTASSWILMPDALTLAQDEFETPSLEHVDQYLVALNEHSQSDDAWDLAVYTESVTWAGAYVGEVLRRTAKRELHWTTYEDAMDADPENANELGERNDFNEFVLCSPSGHAVSPMDAAAAVFVDGYLQSVAQFVAEEAAVEDPNEACEKFAEARSRNDETLYHLPAELRVQLTGATAQDQRVWAQHYQQQGATDLALDALFESLQAAPFELATLHELAALYAVKNDQERVLAFYQRALAVAPNNPLTLEHRGRYYGSRGKSELAISDLRAAIEVEDTVSRRETVGQWLAGLGRHEEAAEEYRKALELAGPEADSSTLANLTACIAEQQLLNGSVGEAMQTIEPLLQQHGVAAGSLAWMCRGRIHATQQQWGAAAADLVAAARLDDQNAEAFARLAWIWATAPDDNVRQTEKCLQAARKAQVLSKDQDLSVLVFEALAAALARNGQFDQAVAAQQRAVTAARRTQRDAAAARLQAYQNKQPWTEGGN